MDFHTNPWRVYSLGESLSGDNHLRHPDSTRVLRLQDLRDSFALEGQLPWEQVQTRTTGIAKHTFLQSLKEQDRVLCCSLLPRHLRALVPIIYTPTEVRISLILLSIPFTLVIATARAQDCNPKTDTYSSDTQCSDGSFAGSGEYNVRNSC